MLFRSSKYSSKILNKPKDYKYWILFTISIISTLITSLFPTFGLLTSLLLPIIQIFSLERATLPLREHFSFLHSLTVDFFSSFLFMLMIIIQSLANFFLGPISAIVNVPLFCLIWWLYEIYCRSHFRRVSEHRKPIFLELALISLLFGVILIIPTGILLAVLITYFGA